MAHHSVTVGGPDGQEPAPSAVSSPDLFSPANIHDALGVLFDFQPTRDEPTIPLVKDRPLGTFSDVVVEDLGVLARGVEDGRLSALQLYSILERRAERVSEEDVSAVVRAGGRRQALARLDAVFAERAVAVAFTRQSSGDGPATWKAIRAESRLWHLCREFAAADGTHPFLAWADIASRHPVLDPRSLMAPGKSRDHEVFMYRCQWAIDVAHRYIVDKVIARAFSPEDVAEIAEVAKRSMRLMGHLGRVRDSGEFYRLDPYLGTNGEVHGHATGAFSAWVLLGGWITRAKPEYLTRLMDPSHWAGFDGEARPYLDKIMSGALVPVDPGLAPEALNAARHALRGFHASHRVAVAKHAPTSLADPSPLDPSITNDTSMRRATA